MELQILCLVWIISNPVESIKRYQPFHFKIIHPITRIPPPPYFLKPPIPPPYWQIDHPSFSYWQKCNYEIKFKKYYPCKTTTYRWLFHFQVHSKVHVRYNKIHARQCLYIISLYCREGSISLLYPKESFKCNFKTARKKRFFNGATANWFLFVTM